MPAHQGVTLGGTGKESGKRHPTLEENVVIGAGAKVLGGIRIGKNTRIGAGSVVVKNVSSNCTVVGIPGRIIHKSGTRVDPLAHSALPDTEARIIKNLMDRIDQLEQEMNMLQKNTNSIEQYLGKPKEYAENGKAQNLMDKEIVEMIGDE